MEKRIARIADMMGLPILVDGSTAGIWSKDRVMHAGVLHNARGWAIDTMRHVTERRLPKRTPVGSDEDGMDDRIRRALSPALAIHRRDVTLTSLGLDPAKAPAWAFRASRAVLQLLDGDEPIRTDLVRRFGYGGATYGNMSFDLATGGRPRFVLDRDRVLLDSWSIGRLALREDLRGLTATLRDANLPETVAATLKGRRLEQVVGHPRIAGTTIEMTSANSGRGGLEMGFGRSVEPLAPMPEGVALEWVA